MTDWAQVRQREHVVYRLRGRGGRLLYVGCTSNLEGRLADHRRNLRLKPVWEETDYDGPYDFETARRIEAALIASERPPHNVQGVPA